MKKKIFIPLAIGISLLLLALTLLFIFMNSSYAFSVGRCITCDSGSVIAVIDSSPVILRDNTKNNDLGKGLSDGDKILIIHDGIEESYPARTAAYLTIKLSDGSSSDIPENITDSLIQLGYIKKEAPSSQSNVKKEAVKISYTDGGSVICPTSPPPEEKVKIIRTTGDLLFHWEEVAEEHTTVIYEPSDKYDDAFFEKNYLLLVYVFHHSGMTEFKLSDITKEADNLTVSIQSYTPVLATDNCYASWLFIELSNSVDIFGPEFVNVEIKELESFSYRDFLYFTNDYPYVRFEGFVNCAPNAVNSQDDAIKLSKHELPEGFSYDTVTTAFDKSEGIWRVSFYTEGVDGGCIDVYISEYGITKAIMPGE